MSKKSISIQEVEDYLNATYEIRLNEINLELDYRPLGSNEPFQLLNENDLFRDLDKQKKGISMATLMAILNSSFVNKFNPLLAYFEGNKELYSNSSQLDYIEILANHISAKDQVRFNHQFKKMLVRTIACALENDVFNKQAFILVQKSQNGGKTSFWRWLCPPSLKQYFMENITPDKDGIIALSTNILINLDELSTLKKTELNTLKSIFSKDKVKVRPPYGRKTISMPRRSSFVGSTNLFDFLNDESGSVRWLCFEINSIDWNYSNNVSIDLIWSQAYALYNSGFNYELSADEIRENEILNERFQYVSNEQDIILETLLPGSKEDHDRFMSSTDIISFLIEYNTFHIQLKPVLLGKALTKLGYEKCQLNSKHGYYVKFSERIKQVIN